MSLFVHSPKKELLKDKGPVWPEEMFRMRGLTVKPSTAYPAEIWWKAPYFIVAAMVGESLQDVLAEVEILPGSKSKLPTKLPEVVRLLSGQDPYWRMYGVDFVNEDRMNLNFVHFDESTYQGERFDSLMLDFRKVNEIAIRVIQLDREDTPPQRKLVYKRTQGDNAANQRVALGLWGKTTGHEIIQYYTESRDKVLSYIPIGKDIDISIDAL